MGRTLQSSSQNWYLVLFFIRHPPSLQRLHRRRLADLAIAAVLDENLMFMELASPWGLTPSYSSLELEFTLLHR